MKTTLCDTKGNEALQDEVKRLRIELEEAKRRVGGLHGEILVHSVVNSLPHQAKLISTLIAEQDRYSGPRNLGSV